MMRAAIIQNGKVQNVVELNSLGDLPGAVACPDNDIGDAYDGVNFTKAVPVPVIPSVVTMRQARLALLGAGLLTTVNSAIAAMSGTAGDAARIEWEFAATVDRGSPLVASLSAALNLSPAQLDSLFSAAAVL